MFSESDLVGILALGGATNVAVLLAVLFCVRRMWVVNALFSIVAVFGVANAHAMHTDLFLDQPMVVVGLLAGAGLALFVAFGAIDTLGSRWLALPVLMSIAACSWGGYQIWGRSDVVVAFGDTSNIRDVVFQHRPNLYFVSFDALAPRVLLRKYMGLETTPFHELFETRFRRFENFFVDAVSTRYSLGTLLALDERHYATMWREVRAKTDNRAWDPMLFSGQSPSPLFRLLKNNGYETATAYEDEFFGKRKGAFVDHYYTGGRHVVCGLLDEHIRAVSFWGHCLATSGDPSNQGHEVRQRVIDSIGEAAFRDGPQFAMAHLYTPGHADRSFRYSDNDQLERFRATYLSRLGEASALLSRLLAHLDANDPDAILLVYGDHGAYLSNGVAFADAPEFVVQDHYGVLGGVHPPTACQDEFDATYARQAYMTLLDATLAVLRCLSGGQSALRVSLGSRVIGDWHGVVPGGNFRPYSEFLYE